MKSLKLTDILCQFCSKLIRISIMTQIIQRIRFQMFKPKKKLQFDLKKIFFLFFQKPWDELPLTESAHKSFFPHQYTSFIKVFIISTELHSKQ
jgi:hypothetical protein